MITLSSANSMMICFKEETVKDSKSLSVFGEVVFKVALMDLAFYLLKT